MVRATTPLSSPHNSCAAMIRPSFVAFCSCWVSLLMPLFTPGSLSADTHETEAILASPDSVSAWSYALSPADESLLDEIQNGCFQYFWKEVGDPAMLAKDKTSDTICSIAAVGFQLSSLPIGVERGWITREQGQQRALAILTSLRDRRDNKKYGIYFHFVDKDTGGLPDFSKTKYPYELRASTVDHALFQAGAMTAASYFGGDVAKIADEIIEDANWQAYQNDEDGYLNFGWRAETDRGVDGPGKMSEWVWQRASDEERLIYFLAVGSPCNDHAIAPESYYRLERHVKQHDNLPPYVVSWNGSLFTYFFAHCWIDYRHLGADDPNAFGVVAPRVDWFENSRRAVLTQRQRCIEAGGTYPTLSTNRWGLAPCAFKDHYLVHETRPNIVDQDKWHDGVVPPYAAGSAIMFAPAESLAAMREYRGLKDRHGQPLVWRDPDQDGYGFVDSFHLDPPYGQEEYLGIDQGPMLLAIENIRSGLPWRLFMQHDVAKRAVKRLQLKPR